MLVIGLFAGVLSVWITLPPGPGPRKCAGSWTFAYSYRMAGSVGMPPVLKGNSGASTLTDVSLFP